MGLILAIGGVLIIAVALVGVLYTMGVGPFAVDTVATPTTPVNNTPVASEATSTSEPSTEVTETASLPSVTVR